MPATGAPGAGPGVRRTCPRCGTSFGCGALDPAGPPCWCAALDVPLSAGIELAAYDGCLCPGCLALIARGG